MTSTNLTVNFISPEDIEPEPEDGYGNISLDLDPDANEDTNFQVGDTAFLRVICSGFRNSETYEMLRSAGTLARSATDVRYLVEETITFPYTTSQSLKYMPDGNVEWEWIGNAPVASVSLQVDENSAKLVATQRIVAVANVTYYTLGDRWALSYDEEGQVVVVALRENKTVSVTVGFGIDEIDDEIGPFSWQILTKNNATGQPEPNINIDIQGVGSFITDSNGRVFVGVLSSGTYDCVLTGDDIISSPEDAIDNDSFTIPSTRPNDEDNVL